MAASLARIESCNGSPAPGMRVEERFVGRDPFRQIGGSAHLGPGFAIPVQTCKQGESIQISERGSSADTWIPFARNPCHFET